MNALHRCAAPLVALAVAACHASGPLASVPQTPLLSVDRDGHAGASPIKHVVFIVQENRSFNNLFMNYPGATTQTYGFDSNGNKIQLQPENLSTTWDIDHFSHAFFVSCNGRGKIPGKHCRMNGWNLEVTGIGAPKNAPYSYVPETQVDPYWKMAKQYVLADKMFASNLDGSFISHQYVVAAFASRAVDAPFGPWGCEGQAGDNITTLTPSRQYGAAIPACFKNPTIASEADTAGLSWRFYTGSIYGDGGLWSAYQADKPIYDGPDWSKDVINPPSGFLTDIKGKHGTLASITWITPTYENSDHPGLSADGGPAWVSSVVNAVGESPFWKSTAIFIVWDDWGGLFDSVGPPYVDYDGLGMRVPLIVISPYAKKGYVTEVPYETSSVLRFIENNFGLPPLAKSDARANDPATDAFDYSQTPRKFAKFAGGKPDAFWIERDRHPRWQGKPPAMIGDD